MKYSDTPTIRIDKFTPLFAKNLSLPTKLFMYTGMAFFMLSLLLTSFFIPGDNIQGVWILIAGWLGLLIFQLSWFANPLNLLAVLLITKRPILALVLSTIAFLLASQTFSFSEIPAGLNYEKIFIKEMGLGFYFWYFSHGLFLFAISTEALIKVKKNED